MEGDSIKWINEEFLKLAITNGGKDESVTIIEYSIKPAVESGNNYCTQLFRVKTDYQQGNTKKSKYLIIKAPLAEGSFAKSVVDEAKLVGHEYVMYTEILPEIYAISKHQFGPKTYFCDKTDVLIMDDLTAEGYNMSDRLQQLDLHHCKQFLMTLAKYHAATVALHRQNAELVESNGVHPFYNENMKNHALMYIETIKQNTFVAILEKLTGMEVLTETIKRCGNALRTAVMKVFKQRGSVNVLNHGDCWTNNIMFKYGGGGEVADCKLIDFQIRSYGSPAIDLLYFLFTSVRTEVRRQHMEELLKLYCDTLNKTLMELNYKERLSLQHLREEMKRASPWALFTVVQYLPLILNEPDELVEKLKKDEENMKSHDINVNPALRIFLGKTYNAVLPRICDDLIKLGVIDCITNLNS